MADFHLIEPFDLEGLASHRPEEAFAFGVEWESFRRRLLGGAPFSILVMVGNASRLETLASRHGRFIEAHASDSPSLVCLVVGGEGR